MQAVQGELLKEMFILAMICRVRHKILSLLITLMEPHCYLGILRVLKV